MVGIENIRVCVAFGIKLTEGIDERLADDGKISLIEGVGLIPVLKNVPDIIRSRSTLVEEIKDLSAEELADIRQYVEENLDIRSDKSEAIVNKSLDLVVSVKELIDTIAA